jgi:2-iminobutanoate/2-iminopropanoate deaminase
MEFIRADWQWDRDAPMCAAVRTGDFLWLTGMTAIGDDGEVVGVGNLQAQARQVFANIGHVLSKAGGELASVIRLTNYFAIPLNPDVAEEYWQVRREVFGDHHPASTGVQVVGLLRPEMMLEIDAVAYLPSTAA